MRQVPDHLSDGGKTSAPSRMGARPGHVYHRDAHHGKGYSCPGKRRETLVEGILTASVSDYIVESRAVDVRF